MHEADLPEVLRLERQCQQTPWPAYFFRRLLRRPASCWVYAIESRVIGYGIMLQSREWTHIMNLCIAPSQRRYGLGRKMLLHLLSEARRLGAKRAWLEVHPDNHSAIALYKRLGFTTQYRRKGYYRHYPQRQGDALLMVCKLAQ